eukprot:1062696-Lingulodinium_polyedra.AAC.1
MGWRTLPVEQKFALRGLNWLSKRIVIRDAFRNLFAQEDGVPRAPDCSAGPMQPQTCAPWRPSACDLS